MPQTGWLETIETCSLTALEARSPNLRCQQGQAPSEVSGGGTVPRLSPSFRWYQQFLVLRGLWPHYANLCLHPDTVSLCVSSLFIRTSLIGSRIRPNPVWPTLTEYISKYGHMLRFWVHMNLGELRLILLDSASPQSCTPCAWLHGLEAVRSSISQNTDFPFSNSTNIFEHLCSMLCIR